MALSSHGQNCLNHTKSDADAHVGRFFSEYRANMLSGDSEIEHSSTSTGVRERSLTGLDAVTCSGGDRLEQVAAALVSLLS